MRRLTYLHCQKEKLKTFQITFWMLWVGCCVNWCLCQLWGCNLVNLKLLKCKINNIFKDFYSALYIITGFVVFFLNLGEGDEKFLDLGESLSQDPGQIQSQVNTGFRIRIIISLSPGRLIFQNILRPLDKHIITMLSSIKAYRRNI